MAFVIPALIGAGIYRIYNRKNATEKELTLPKGKTCDDLTKSPGKKWVPFKGGILRRTDKCALCPEGTAAVELHRIGNNECVGGSDSRRSKASKKRSRKAKGKRRGGCTSP